MDNMFRERTPRLVAAVAGLLGLLVAILVTGWLQSRSSDRIASWLETRAEIVEEAITQSLEDSASDIAALAGYIEGRSDTSQEELARFADRLDLSPSLVASAFAREVPRNELDAYAQEMRHAMPGFTLTTLDGVEYSASDVDKELVYPVQFLVPGPFLSAFAAGDPDFKLTNALGYDASGEGAWGSSVATAIQRGELTVSDFFAVGELDIGKAFVILDPVSRDGELLGVFGSLALDRLLAVDVSFGDEIVWELSSATEQTPTASNLWSQDISFAGATWRLTVQPSEAAAAELAGVPAWALLGIGLMLSVLLASFAHEVAQRSLDHRHIESLQQAAADKDRFLAAVSHEIRTPLTVVTGLAHELSEYGFRIGPDEPGELLAEIAAQSDEMTAIIEDLLVAARTDIRNVSIHPASIGLRSEALAAIPPAAPASLEVAEVEVTAYADPGRVRQIVRNLLTNAVRYGGPQVSISFHPGRNVVGLAVSDNGAPIPDDRRDSIFEPYTSAHQRAPELGSIGLGLFISRELARLMAGDLTYSYVDGMSRFLLSLPAGLPERRLAPTEKARSVEVR